MELITLTEDIMVNPEKISIIERTISFDNVISITVTVEGRTIDVTVPTSQFMQAIYKAGIDPSKQFFSV